LLLAKVREGCTVLRLPCPEHNFGKNSSHVVIPSELRAIKPAQSDTTAPIQHQKKLAEDMEKVLSQLDAIVCW
jgi:hypothetical protein